MSFYSIFGYLSGLYFIKPDLDATTLVRTAVIVHICDAVLCALIAGHSARNKKIWIPAGFIFGIWALAILFVLPSKKNNTIARPVGC